MMCGADLVRLVRLVHVPESAHAWVDGEPADAAAQHRDGPDVNPIAEHSIAMREALPHMCFRRLRSRPLDPRRCGGDRGRLEWRARQRDDRLAITAALRYRPLEVSDPRGEGE